MDKSALAMLLADPAYRELDWFELAIRHLGGITKTAALVGLGASTLRRYRQQGWSALSWRAIRRIAKASGVPMVNLLTQCERELARAA